MFHMPAGTLEPGVTDVIVECCMAADAVAFDRLIGPDGHLHGLLRHDMVVAGIGGIGPHGSVVHKVVNLNYPAHYFERLHDDEGRVDSPLMKKWRDTREPVLFQLGRDDAHYPERWVKNFRSHGLRNTLAHGVRDLTGALSSFFVFSQLAGEVDQRHAFLLRMLTPLLHEALSRALPQMEDQTGGPRAPHGKRVSARQREILHWLREGKTNWEIAQLLGLTPLNVKYHVEQIYSKLGVHSRTQAVVKAVDMGLLGRLG